MASPTLMASLPSTGKLRAVDDAGGTLLPSTDRSRAVADAVAVLLPSADRLRAVDDASLLSLPLTDLSVGRDGGDAALLLT